MHTHFLVDITNQPATEFTQSPTRISTLRLFSSLFRNEHSRDFLCCLFYGGPDPRDALLLVLWLRTEALALVQHGGFHLFTTLQTKCSNVVCICICMLYFQSPEAFWGATGIFVLYINGPSSLSAFFHRHNKGHCAESLRLKTHTVSKSSFPFVNAMEMMFDTALRSRLDYRYID